LCPTWAWPLPGVRPRRRPPCGATEFIVMQHDPSNTISLAVWDVPMPVVASEKFSIKVGAKTMPGHALAGCRIEVSDSSGAVVATGRLGEAPWPETEALYWAALDIPAPTQQRFAEYAVRFVPDSN